MSDDLKGLSGFEGTLKTALFAMVGLGLCAISATGEIFWPHMAAFALGMIIGWVRDEANKPLKTAVWNTLILMIFLVCAVYAFRSSEAFIKGVVYFLSYVMLIRLVSRKDARDTRWLFILGFLTMCGASILTISMNFLLFLVAYMVAASWALMAFILSRDISTDSRDTSEMGVGLSLFKVAGATSVMILVLSSALFFMIPRMSSGFLAWASRAAPKVSGFSETVSLGQVGKIKMDRSTVMRISIEGEDTPRDNIYWRGIALDGFNGTTWYATNRKDPANIPMKDNAMFIVKKGKRLKDLVKQEIFMEPIENPVLFGASEPFAYRLYKPGEIPSNPTQLVSFLLAYYTDYYTLPFSTPTYDRVKYYAYSNLDVPSADELRKAWENQDKNIFEDYTRLRSLSPDVEKLALDITEDSDNVYDKTMAIQEYLLDNYEYSLEAASWQSNTPVDDFLFKTREGHCEYFATAMAVMLRSIKIPVRVVNGFQRGEWNEYQHYYHVRQSDAHSWVEVYFPGYGWITFDPTPASSRMYDETIGSLEGFFSYFDSWRFRWNRWVVDYSFQDQMNISRNVKIRSSKTSSNLQIKMQQLRDKLSGVLLSGPGIFISAGIIFAVGLVFIIRRSLRGRLGRNKMAGVDEQSALRMEASRLYSGFLEKIKKRGLKKAPHETPLEFAFSASPLNSGARERLLEATQMYYNLRYSAAPPTMESLEQLKSSLQDVGNLIKRR